MDSEKRILLVEDDPNFGIILRDYLAMNRYQVSLAKNGLEGFEKFKKNDFDLCILDVMMPYKDGFTLAKEIRENNSEVPIVFLTAKSMKDDMIKGYKLGADDYLTKPFDSEILLHKINALFNRQKHNPILNNTEFEFEIGDFSFNSKLRYLQYKEEPHIKLSPKENELLRLLFLHKDDLMSRELALTKIWRDDNYFTSRSMDVYIAKIRKYLKKDTRVQIINVHGEGFRLNLKEEA